MVYGANLSDWTCKHTQDECFPTFLDLFQAIPLSPPDVFFTKIKTIFNKFIWNNRQARLCLSLLYLLYDRGGLGIPDLKWYYWAAHLSTASCWFIVTKLSWVNLERTSTTSLLLSSYLYSAKYKDLMCFNHLTQKFGIPPKYFFLNLFKSEALFQKLKNL